MSQTPIILFLSFFSTHSFHSMFYLTDEEVYLQRRLCFTRLQVGHHYFCQDVTKVLHLSLLLFLVGFLMQFD